MSRLIQFPGQSSQALACPPERTFRCVGDQGIQEAVQSRQKGGVFFDPLFSASTLPANAPERGLKGGIQFLHAPGDGASGKPCGPGNPGDPSTTHGPCLGPGKEPELAFIQMRFQGLETLVDNFSVHGDGKMNKLFRNKCLSRMILKGFCLILPVKASRKGHLAAKSGRYGNVT
jgi:hypothetical protein